MLAINCVIDLYNLLLFQMCCFEGNRTRRHVLILSDMLHMKYEDFYEVYILYPTQFVCTVSFSLRKSIKSRILRITRK
jgi:hypothetical protein